VIINKSAGAKVWRLIIQESRAGGS